MVWSCISWYGVGYIVDVDKNMDKNVYLSVLQDDLVKSMTGYCEENDLIMADFEFMQDNDPKHTVGEKSVATLVQFSLNSTFQAN
ncbi:hypothetical protein G6F43_013062 [Rhizopus delemar]|nr:hypothetical protein G6F43_013062 [Rhizopus delemar]